MSNVEGKVAFLLRRDEEPQRNVNVLRQRLAALEAESQKRPDLLEAHVETGLAAAEADGRTVRVFGWCLLVVGLALAAAANFISDGTG